VGVALRKPEEKKRNLTEPELELELELIQSHMTQKPMLRGEGGGRACAHKQDPNKLLENNHWEGVLRKSAPGIINAARRFATWFITHARLQYLATIIEDAGTMLPSRS